MQIPGIDQEQITQADSLMRAGIENRVHNFAVMTWEQRFHTIVNDLWDFGLKVAVVIAIFIIGRWLIKRLVKLLAVIFEKRRVDPSLRTFTRSILEIFLYLVLFYLMIAWLGVNTSLFVALFAAAGLAIGMALSGVFQNFAGGVMILMLRPFRVGDWIELEGQSGSVTDIKLFNTVLRTADNKTILLPNGSVSTSIVDNFNVAKTRRLEWAVSLALGTDFVAVQRLLTDLVRAESRIMTIPAPEVVLARLNVNSLDVIVHGWVESGDYWDVFYNMNAKIYKALPERGFSFPSSSLAVTLEGGSPRLS